MEIGLYAAASGALSNERKVEVLSHNLANVSTPNFTEFRVAFESIKANNAIGQVTFVKPTEMQRNVSAGPLRATGNPMDVSLAEGVYLAVEDGGRTAYVRGATLTLQENGSLVTDTGYTLLGEEEALSLPPTSRDINIAADGSITVDGSPGGKLRITEFENQQALVQRRGGSYLDPGGAKPMPTNASQPVIVGYREESNLSLIRGMTDLISANRHYDLSMKAV